jgi:hypothetical protein
MLQCGLEDHESMVSEGIIDKSNSGVGRMPAHSICARFLRSRSLNLLGYSPRSHPQQQLLRRKYRNTSYFQFHYRLLNTCLLLVSVSDLTVLYVLYIPSLKFSVLRKKRGRHLLKYLIYLGSIRQN